MDSYICGCNQVDRKLVKQTVMTSVYGVTLVGAKDQISQRLKERASIGNERQLFSASCYAAKVSHQTAICFEKMSHLYP